MALPRVGAQPPHSWLPWFRPGLLVVSLQRNTRPQSVLIDLIDQATEVLLLESSKQHCSWGKNHLNALLMTSTRESQRGKYFRTFIWRHSCVAVAWYRCRFWNCEWCEFCEWHYWRVGSCRVTWVPDGMQGQATLSRHWSCPTTILQMENQTSVVPTIARIIGKTISQSYEGRWPLQCFTII